MKSSRFRSLASTIGAAVLVLAVMPHIYFIANQFGITLAPHWYQTAIDWVSSGGTVAGFFAVMFGITVPAWLAAVAAGFGVTSA